MADPAQLACLRKGVIAWNTWRAGHGDARLDLSRANLRGMRLSGANLSGAHLNHARLNDADLSGANLCGAHLHAATLSRANLTGTDLRHADLTEAKLFAANLFATKLNSADLSHADLRYAMLVRTRLEGAILTDCIVYGASAWDVRLTGSVQTNLVISPPNSYRITVDNLEVAQFLYLMLQNQRLRDVLDTIAKKVVLILGRFNDDRKPTLNALRLRLRELNYSPIVFDFQVPATRDFTETVQTLALLSRFIVADVTDPRSIPQELQAIVPNVSVPVQPVLHEGGETWATLKTFEKYPWFLPIYHYQDTPSLIAALPEHIIGPAEAKAHALRPTPTAQAQSVHSHETETPGIADTSSQSD